MTDKTFNLKIKTESDPRPVERFVTVMEGLEKQLAAAQVALAGMDAGSEEYAVATAAVGELAERITAVIRPVREHAEAEAQATQEMVQAATAARNLSAAVAAGVNPWTTASASYVRAAQELARETAAAKEAQRAHEALTRAKQEQTRTQYNEAVLVAQRQWAADLREAEVTTSRLAASAKKANEEQRKTPAVNDAAAKSTRNNGMAVLAFSQGLEDAQYGIRGILNNIPSLVMAMGGGMGLAGVISVAAVSLSVLSEWFGKTKAAGEAISWAKLTPDEEAIGRLERYNEKLRESTAAIDAQAAAWERAAAAQKAATDRQKEHDEYLSAKAKQSGIEGDPQQTLQDYDTRTRQRQDGLAGVAQGATAARVDADKRVRDAAEKAQAAQQQAARVEALERRAGYEQMLKDVGTELAELAKAESLAGVTFEKSDELRARAEQINREMAKLPTADFQPTGDAAKDAEAMRAAMERERQQAKALADEEKKAREKALAAELKAQEKAQALADAQQKAAEAQELDADATEAKVRREAGLPEGLPRLPGEARNGGRTDPLDPAVRGLLGRGGNEADATPESAEDADRRYRQEFANEEVSQVASGLDALQAKSQDPAMQGKIQEILASLTDRDGATQADLERAKSYLEQANAGNAENQRMVVQLAQGVANVIDAMRGDLTSAWAAIEALKNGGRR